MHLGKCLFLAVDLCEIHLNAPGRSIGERCWRIAQQAFQVSLQTGKAAVTMTLIRTPALGSVLARTLGDSINIDI